VMITAHAEMLKASNQPLNGVDFVISKPFLLFNLREAINRTTPATAARQHAMRRTGARRRSDLPERVKKPSPGCYHRL